MHAQERQLRIRNRVDQALDDRGRRLVERQVRPTKRNDARVRWGSRRHRQSVRPQAGAPDDEGRLEGAATSFEVRRRSLARQRGDRGIESDVNSVFVKTPREGRRHLVVVDDSGVGTVQRGHAETSGLHLGNLLGAEPAESRDVVGPSAPLQLVESR